jgi:hypothetical protein
LRKKVAYVTYVKQVKCKNSKEYPIMMIMFRQSGGLAQINGMRLPLFSGWTMFRHICRSKELLAIWITPAEDRPRYVAKPDI